MINNNKSNSSNSLSVILLVFIFLLSNLSFAADSDADPDDFSNAENAEEKRAKWGTEEFKLELIKEMSSANIALFIDEHLKTITEPSRIFYKFKKESTREDNFVGNVVLNIVKIDDDNTKHITFRYLKGRNKVRFPPQIGAKGNPVFMLFFERDSRDMQRLTGGNALFFRSRIRHTIAATDVKDIKINYNNQEIAAKEIAFQPFTKTELKNRVSRQKNLLSQCPKKFLVLFLKLKPLSRIWKTLMTWLKRYLSFRALEPTKNLEKNIKKERIKINHDK